jgi:anti-sigma factor RsiW
MSTQAAFRGPHLDDGELVRYMDTEGTDEEARRWHDHLAACPRCRREAETLRAQSDAVARWLAMADFDSRATPVAGSVAPMARAGRAMAWAASATRGPWLKAAAITLLLAAPLAAIPPVRGWIAEQVALLRADGPAPVATLHAPAGPGASAIRFVPDPGTFTLVMDAAQLEGSLHVGRAPGAEAVLEVRGDGVLPEPTVSARSVRIANTETTVVSYSLSLPAGVEWVRVAIGGRQILLGAGEVDRSTTINMGQGP